MVINGENAGYKHFLKKVLYPIETEILVWDTIMFDLSACFQFEPVYNFVI